MKHKSDLALAAATRWPRLGGWAVRLWWRREQRRHPSKRHRLLEAMKDRTKTPLRKLFILPAGQKFLADPFCYVGRQLECSSAYEPETVATFEALVQPGMTVADIGANLGHHTLILAALVGVTGSVHAFEPHPETFQELVTNIRLNGYGHVHCSDMALSSKAGGATLHLAADAAMHSLGPTKYYGEQKVAVETETLDGYVQRHSLSRLDVVKIDVEGAERLVIEGGAATFEAFRPILIVELSEHSSAFGYSDADLFADLKSLNYSLFMAGTPPFEPLDDVVDVEFYNVVAVPPAQLDRLVKEGRVKTRVGGSEPRVNQRVGGS
jgi:FkbM family methyltransferase